jgi:hypothetical protein
MNIFDYIVSYDDWEDIVLSCVSAEELIFLNEVFINEVYGMKLNNIESLNLYYLVTNLAQTLLDRHE